MTHECSLPYPFCAMGVLTVKKCNSLILVKLFMVTVMLLVTFSSKLKVERIGDETSA